MSANAKKMTMGVIVGNRGFFPDHLAKEGREEIVKALTAASIEPLVLSPEESKYGAVETRVESRKCADQFRANRDRIDGVIVTLPNFGEERAIADTLRLADLNVPVLIQATPDSAAKMSIKFRRDSFCGKMSACNNLMQYGIPYSITMQHTEAPDSDLFRKDLAWFAGVCRVVKGLRRVRIGALGARPAAFNTVRYSEKILERHGISIETVDLTEILGRIHRMKDSDDAAQQKLAAIRSYVSTQGIPDESLIKMAKLGAVVDHWMKETEVVMSAVQCWTAIEEYFGVVPCTVMSMMSNDLLPSACEVDICGVVGMYALQLASGTPSALLDWNNNYGEDPDKCVFFHCGNWAKEFLPDIRIATAPILGTTLGEENTFGALEGRTQAGPVTFGRISTDDLSGKIVAFVGEGEFTDDPLKTFGTRAVVRVAGLPALMHVICQNGFEHHAAMNRSHTAAAVAEALGRYLGWTTYHHNR